MARETFIDKRFTTASKNKLGLINDILDEYNTQGYDLTLRQLYYQLVARGNIENSQRSYKNLGGLVNDGRLAGLIDWNMIVDRTRGTAIPPHWRSPASILQNAARAFAIDKWEDQENHIEVVVEKDALRGVLEPVCDRLDINFTASKGYPSVTLLHRMSKRLLDKHYEDKKLFILHLADHDPSGLDMTRDLADRFKMFTRIDFEVLRLALNMEQVQMLNPPENPAKVTDSRYDAYVIEFGESSWELDAIEPRQLSEIIENQVKELRDEILWWEAVSQEQEWKDELYEFADTYEE